MHVDQWRSILTFLICALILAGCSSEKAAKTIRELRKAGDLAGARHQAVELLTANPNQMPVWRELAWTDEALSRLAMEEDRQRTAYLIEGALICVAVCERQEGRAPDEEWAPLVRLVRADLIARGARTLNGVTLQLHQETRRGGFDAGGLEELFDERGHRRMTPEIRSWTGADPADAEAAVGRYAPLKALSMRLPAAIGEPTPLDVETELSQRAERWQVPLEQLLRVFEARDRNVEAVCSRIQEDLHEFGHFLPTSVLDHEILQP